VSCCSRTAQGGAIDGKDGERDKNGLIRNILHPEGKRTVALGVTGERIPAVQARGGVPGRFKEQHRDEDVESISYWEQPEGGGSQKMEMERTRRGQKRKNREIEKGKGRRGESHKTTRYPRELGKMTSATGAPLVGSTWGGTGRKFRRKDTGKKEKKI